MGCGSPYKHVIQLREEILEFSHASDIDILILTEVDMDSKETGIFKLHGYKTLEAIPTGRNQIRTIMLIKEDCDFKYRLLQDEMSAKFPCIWIHIKVKATSMVMCGLYRPWTTRAKESYIKIQEEELCLLYTSPSPRDKRQSRMPSSA